MKDKVKYPKEVYFEKPRFSEENLEIKEVVANTKMTLLDENILQVEYPQDLVKQIRCVNVDDSIFRLDFVLYKSDYVRYCFFPHCGWNRENFFKNKRIDNYKRDESDGRLVLTFPKLD